MMYEVGDKITFTPSAYTDGNGAKMAKSKVRGVVTDVNLDHRWYRVA